jgi:hypothetical protein
MAKTAYYRLFGVFKQKTLTNPKAVWGGIPPAALIEKAFRKNLVF